ncbi:MAG: type III-B CRISPR module-associated protein Cmr5 [bacterium]|nr:type III-B CRISPR module-associated protein Cmr5 [bacterium]
MINLDPNKTINLSIIKFLNQRVDILKKDKVISEANKFANLIITNGLIPTLAYYESKSEDNIEVNEFYKKIILAFFKEKFKVDENKIFDFLLNKNPSELLFITNFMLYFANYLKYFIKDKENDKNN